MKLMGQAMANNAGTFEDLDELHAMPEPSVPIISIPTSLSGGEYSFLGGGTNDKTHHKHGFGHPTKGPALVILDPRLTTSTPDNIWLRSGVRAVDHCVEGMCSLSSTPESDADAAAGLRLLVPGLLRCKADRQDLDARLRCQMGVIEAMKVVFQHGVPMGASHSIGHQLGPLGVGHGETSCILLPAVCAYNHTVNAEQQQKVRNVLLADEEVAGLLSAKGLQGADLGQLLDVFIAELGMPRSPQKVGIGGDKLEMLADNSLKDPWCGTNPRPLRKRKEVMEILETVKG